MVHLESVFFDLNFQSVYCQGLFQQDKTNLSISLFQGIQSLLDDEEKQEQLNLEYLQIHQSLRKNANAAAAEAVLDSVSHKE